MAIHEEIKLFGQNEVRTAWDDEKEQWFFSVTDVVAILTDSADPKQYIKKLRARDSELDFRWGTICTLTRMKAADGKMYNTQSATAEGLFRIIQSIPSKKAEPIKQWLARVGQERLNQMQDPELGIVQAVKDYKHLGYSEKWINQRLRSIEIRKELTDEWQRSGVTEDKDFAALTDIISQAWSGMTTREYKNMKGLHKESLRDNMTNIELALNILAEATTTEYSKASNPKGIKESAKIAKEGGEVAKVAREKMEKRLGRSVLSSDKAIDYIQPTDELPLNGQ
ncbi:MAG: hypothetical protein MJZ88_01865 [Paludibacteraceae bacterium]|nr:hypothetical protein [Paludibacteraceae bacterium]